MFKNSRVVALMVLSVLLMSSSLAQADDVPSLKRQVSELESRVEKLEKLLDEKFADDRWKDGILWSRIRQGMSFEDVRKLLGKPARVEEAIFTTWYYHKTSKLHSHVWFDEGKVLGWDGLEQKHRPVRRLKP
ncbi:MAG: hypothetical protein HKP55_03240 [Gammaproteobacteria bacterium]|nr:hypothetical protein [Gammaproteobacteria bacterium]